MELLTVLFMFVFVPVVFWAWAALVTFMGTICVIDSLRHKN